MDYRITKSNSFVLYINLFSFSRNVFSNYYVPGTGLVTDIPFIQKKRKYISKY